MRRRHSTYVCSFFMAMFGLADPTSAVPLIFDEGEFYPFGFEGNPFLGTLDVGVNVVRGDTVGRFGFFSDADAFNVALPQGLAITSIELAVTNFYDNSAESSGIGLRSPNSGSASFDGDGTVIVSPFAIASSPITFDLWPGVSSDSGEDFPWDSYWYVLSITVAVPEPSTFALLMLGLAGLVAARRRAARPVPFISSCSRHTRR